MFFFLHSYRAVYFKKLRTLNLFIGPEQKCLRLTDSQFWYSSQWKQSCQVSVCSSFWLDDVSAWPGFEYHVKLFHPVLHRHYGYWFLHLHYLDPDSTISQTHRRHIFVGLLPLLLLFLKLGSKNCTSLMYRSKSHTHMTVITHADLWGLHRSIHPSTTSSPSSGYCSSNLEADLFVKALQ